LIFDGEGEGEQAVVNMKLNWGAGTRTAEFLKWQLERGGEALHIADFLIASLLLQIRQKSLPLA